MPRVELIGIGKSFGPVVASSNIDLVVEDKEYSHDPWAIGLRQDYTDTHGSGCDRAYNGESSDQW